MPAQAVVEIEPRYFELAVLDEIALGQAAGERHSLARCGARLWGGPRHRCWWEVTPGTLEPTGQSRAPQCAIRSSRSPPSPRSKSNHRPRFSPERRKERDPCWPHRNSCGDFDVGLPNKATTTSSMRSLSAFVISGIIVRHPFDGERLHRGLRPAIR